MTPSGGIVGGSPVQDLPTMYAPAPAKRRRSDDDGGQQQQYQQGPPIAVPPTFAFQPQSGSAQQQVQFPGVQQPFQLPIQLAQLSGMSQQQQLPVQFSVGAPAPSMAVQEEGWQVGSPQRPAKGRVRRPKDDDGRQGQDGKSQPTPPGCPRGWGLRLRQGSQFQWHDRPRRHVVGPA